MSAAALAGLSAASIPSQNAAEFLLEHGRLPHLGKDPLPPWAYSGYQLFYIQECEMHLNREKSRWSYYLRTLEAGGLLDEPIPQIEFGHSGTKGVSEGSKALDKWLDIVWHEEGSSGAFRKLLEWLLWGIGKLKEYPSLSEKTQEALYRAVNFEKLLREPYDYLGNAYQDTKTSRWNNSGFYVSPHAICDLMTSMTMCDLGREPDGKDPRLVTVNEPCCGSGRMLLHASNHSFNLSGQDIDWACVAMTQLNGAFYAPWLTWPFSDAILGKPAPRRDERWDSLIRILKDTEPQTTPEIPEALIKLLPPEPAVVSIDSKAKPKKAHRTDSQLSLFDS